MELEKLKSEGGKRKRNHALPCGLRRCGGSAARGKVGTLAEMKQEWAKTVGKAVVL